MSEERLIRIEDKLEQVRVGMSELKAMRERLEEHIDKDEHLFNGNGSPGLVKDVDRLKQWKKAVFWWVGIAVASPALAEVVKVVFSK